MQIQSVSPSQNGKRYPSGSPASSGHMDAAAQPACPLMSEDVLLHYPSDFDLAASVDLETLLALLRGILETVEGTPCGFRKTVRTDTLLLGETGLPAWLQCAQHALSAPGQNVLRLCAIGQLMPFEADALPFVLDMQLLDAPFSRLPQPGTGAFTLGLDAGDYAGANVCFTLTCAETGRTESDFESAARRATPGDLLAGSPIFAQLALGQVPDILCIAARLLPAPAADAPQPRTAHAGDGSYVTTEETSGGKHQLDVSA